MVALGRAGTRDLRESRAVIDVVMEAHLGLALKPEKVVATVVRRGAASEAAPGLHARAVLAEVRVVLPTALEERLALVPDVLAPRFVTVAGLEVTKGVDPAHRTAAERAEGRVEGRRAVGQGGDVGGMRWKESCLFVS